MQHVDAVEALSLRHRSLVTHDICRCYSVQFACQDTIRPHDINIWSGGSRSSSWNIRNSTIIRRIADAAIVRESPDRALKCFMHVFASQLACISSRQGLEQGKAPSCIKICWGADGWLSSPDLAGSTA
jgi:hypothetical protein